VNTASLGSYTILLPQAAPGTLGQFRVSQVVGGVAQLGNSAVSVPVVDAAPSINVTTPSGSANNWTTGVATPISWRHNLGPLDTVSLALSLNGVTYPYVLNNSVACSCSGYPCSANYIYTPTSGLTTATAYVKVTWNANATVTGKSSLAFAIL
jgi:hypothetical protein